ncbi:two-component system response regulator [Dehalogenimonas sp. WBC-2]|nr:two-component system response regulator [Dehalogenimonas sp. WBC-2]
MNEPLKPIQVLLVEDNEADARLMKEVIKDSKIIIDLNIVSDGIEALDYVNQRGKFKQALKPDLILLDLNLPKKDGREVLAEIKNSPSQKRIPVVIITSSQAEEDIVKTYDLHANAYVTKPLDLVQFSKVVDSIELFWFTVVKLPSGLGDG